MWRIGWVLAGLASVAGCTTTRTVLRPRNAEQLQFRIQHQRAPVTLLYDAPERSASPAPLPVVPVPPPTAGDGDSAFTALSTIRGFEVKRPGLGGLEGAVLGAVIGAVAGTVIGRPFMSDDAPCDDPHLCVRFTAGEKAAFIGLLGGIAGALLGMRIGWDIGHTDRVLFVDE
jgi:hypothetical protein